MACSIRAISWATEASGAEAAGPRPPAHFPVSVSARSSARSPGDGQHLHQTASLCQGLPKTSMCRAPAAQRRVGGVCRIGIDEDRPFSFEGNRQLEREVAPGVPHRPPRYTRRGRSWRGTPRASKQSTFSGSVGSQNHTLTGRSSTAMPPARGAVAGNGMIGQHSKAGAAAKGVPNVAAVRKRLLGSHGSPTLSAPGRPKRES